MNYIDSQTLELESLLIPLYEAPLIEIPPSAQILKFSVIVENPNICFDYFYLELSIFFYHYLLFDKIVSDDI